MRGKTGADREISVNTYTGGFTTMLNHHLRNRNLSLKAVGLLSKMLSLPPDWDYSIRGLATLNTDGIDGIRTAMKELEDEGYVVRVQSRDERGRMSRNKYTVYALPQKEKPTQINTNQVIPKKRNDSLSKYQSSVEDITDDIRKQIGWRIQEKRIEKGITAVDLSTYLNITANQVSRIERGCAGIDIYKLIVICKILGVSADYILFGEMKEENPLLDTGVIVPGMCLSIIWFVFVTVLFLKWFERREVK